jgi:hypothetical protein
MSEANEIVGANWGANEARYRATPDHSQPPEAQLNRTSGHMWRLLATAHCAFWTAGRGSTPAKCTAPAGY